MNIETVSGICTLELWHTGQMVDLGFSGFNIHVGGVSEITGVLNVLENGGTFNTLVGTRCHLHLSWSGESENYAQLQASDSGVFGIAILTNVGRLAFVNILKEALTREGMTELQRQVNEAWLAEREKERKPKRKILGLF